jgi:hypothetical protein
LSERQVTGALLTESGQWSNDSSGRPAAVQVGQLDRPLLGSHETFDG